MPNAVVFIQGPASGSQTYEINYSGLTLCEAHNVAEQWTCIVNYSDNATTMQAKIKTCVVAMWQQTWGITIGGADKVVFVGGIS